MNCMLESSSKTCESRRDSPTHQSATAFPSPPAMVPSARQISRLMLVDTACTEPSPQTITMALGCDVPNVYRHCVPFWPPLKPVVSTHSRMLAYGPYSVDRML